MSLFAVQLAENDEMVLVVDAAVVVARDGWWVFRNVDDQPVATLPQAAVCAIDVLAAGDVRGRPWASFADQHRLSLTPGLTVPDPSPTY